MNKEIEQKLQETNDLIQQQETVAVRLLDDSEYLMVNRTLAKALGLNMSIVLRQIHYWININKKANKKDNFQDDQWWTYNTQEDWQQNDFDFWSLDTVIRTFSRLEELGLVKVANYNKRKKDRTKWYTVNYKNYSAFMRLWADHSYPLAGESRHSQAYKDFLEDWAKQKENIEVIDDRHSGNLQGTSPQLAGSVTRDYKEIKDKDKDSAADAAQVENSEESSPSSQEGSLSRQEEKEPSPPTPPSPYQLLVMAVSEYIFNTNPNQVGELKIGGRVGKIAGWLNGTSSPSGMAKISRAATPEHVERFSEWWDKNKNGISKPKDPTKFIEGWREWATTTLPKQPKSVAHKPVVTTKDWSTDTYAWYLNE